MKDAYEVLRQKEAELNRVRHEMESLQVVASLLSEDSTSDELTAKKGISAEKASPATDSQATGTDDLFSSIAASRPGFWKALRRRK
jgi:hypothetical protein